MDDPDTSKKNVYKPINTNSEEELNLHTDGEIPTGESENKYFTTKNVPVRGSNRNGIQPSRSGGVPYTRNVWEQEIEIQFLLQAKAKLLNSTADTFL